jgi:P4 family phage/plasmid primase-like protien
MSKKDLTIGSLKYLAKEDNPSLYDSIITEYTSALCDKCLKLEGTHTDLANLLFQKYEAEFVCASMSNKVWFQFKDHIWQRIDEGYSLRKRISGELVDEYEKKLKTIIDQTEDDDARQKKLNSAMKLIKSLKSSPFKNHIMKEAMEVFYNSNFLFYLDNDPYLIAFYNGVYDIKNHVFREGRPDDYISLKMNISYNNKYTETCKEVLEVFSFFEKIFPDQELRDYFLDSVAELFIGGNFNKIVQIWTGEGDNGKSITQMIFEQMLGPYNIKLPTSLITGKRTQSSAACPELVRAGNGVRLAMLQEPDKKDCINIGVLKELSGNDTFFARGLYKEGQEITPMFKLVLICNEPPKLPYSDKATWNRIKLIPFESTFTNDYPESIEDQFREKKFPKDEQFKDKIPKMLEPLAWYLLHRLKTKPKMKHEPLKVIIATQNFKKKNDIFKQFMDECIIEDKGKMVRNADMYGAFKDWHHESCPHTSCPDKNEFFDYFIRLWGPYNTDGCWSDKSLHGLFDLQ